MRIYAYRTLGQRPAVAIDGAAITDCLAPIWTTKAVTARRVKGRIERVVQWVKDNRPPPQKVTSRVKHHGAIPFEELPAFMAELRKRDGISARALEFCILTAGRTNEVLGAKWSEIKDGVWTVPAERMKGGREHRVPLSDHAIAILEALPREAGGEYVFPGAKAKSPLSPMTMLKLLMAMSGNGYTVHGFRSSFRDWAGERSSFPREVIEHALAHQLKDKAEAAYWRGAAFEKRQRLMEAWATLLQLASVASIRRGSFAAWCRVMTPKRARELLERTADAAGRELRTLRPPADAAPSEVERLEFIASSLESYIASENLPDSENQRS